MQWSNCNYLTIKDKVIKTRIKKRYVETGLSLTPPPPTASWALRKLCGVKDKLSRFMSLPSYRIQEVKDCLEASTPVHWDKWVWHRATIPRVHFVSWLAILGKLATKNKLLRIGIVDNDLCPLCWSEPESE